MRKIFFLYVIIITTFSCNFSKIKDECKGIELSLEELYPNKQIKDNQSSTWFMFFTIKIQNNKDQIIQTRTRFIKPPIDNRSYYKNAYVIFQKDTLELFNIHENILIEPLSSSKYNFYVESSDLTKIYNDNYKNKYYSLQEFLLNFAKKSIIVIQFNNKCIISLNTNKNLKLEGDINSDIEWFW